MYNLPGFGSALAVADAANSFAHGNVGEGIVNSLFAIPGIGGGLKLAGFGLKGLGRATKLISKTPGLTKVGKVSKSLVRTGYNLRRLPNSS